MRASLHSSFEQLVETVCSLHEFERDADQEQFLQLLCSEPTPSKSDNECSNETATSNHNIENIPAIGSEAVPT